MILIVGSILPGLYYGFQHEQGLMIGYMGAMISNLTLDYLHDR